MIYLYDIYLFIFVYFGINMSGFLVFSFWFFYYVSLNELFSNVYNFSFRLVINLILVVYILGIFGFLIINRGYLLVKVWSKVINRFFIEIYFGYVLIYFYKILEVNM